MKFLNIILLATSATALAVNSRSLQGRNRVDHEAAVLARQNVGQGEQGLSELATRKHHHHKGGNKDQGGGAANGTANAASTDTTIRSVATEEQDPGELVARKHHHHKGGNQGQGSNQGGNNSQGGGAANGTANAASTDTIIRSVLGDLAARKHGHHKGGNNQGGGAANGTANAARNDNNIRSVEAGQTLVLKEVNGVPGNECLTFRNNGEIVDAACVDDAADRQVTPATVNGTSVTKVQRAFTADFRPDLVGVEACVGFNGTHFRAEDCASGSDNDIEMVQFDGTTLRAPSGACASGHDGLAQLTVDPAGKTCAQFDTTAVAPTEL